MSHHLVERRKELKRRRKRRQEILKERNKKAALLKTALIVPLVPRKIPKELETVTPIPTKSVLTPTAPARHSHETYLTEPAVIPITSARNPYETDWEKAKSITELIKLLPAGIKTKKIWPAIPEQLKEEIIGRAQHLVESRDFAAPAEWDGSLKQALSLIGSGRLPNGFRIFLGL